MLDLQVSPGVWTSQFLWDVNSLWTVVLLADCFKSPWKSIKVQYKQNSGQTYLQWVFQNYLLWGMIVNVITQRMFWIYFQCCLKQRCFVEIVVSYCGSTKWAHQRGIATLLLNIECHLSCGIIYSIYDHVTCCTSVLTTELNERTRSIIEKIGVWTATPSTGVCRWNNLLPLLVRNCVRRGGTPTWITWPSVGLHVCKFNQLYLIAVFFHFSIYI